MNRTSEPRAIAHGDTTAQRAVSAGRPVPDLRRQARPLVRYARGAPIDLRAPGICRLPARASTAPADPGGRGGRLFHRRHSRLVGVDDGVPPRADRVQALIRLGWRVTLATLVAVVPAASHAQDGASHLERQMAAAVVRQAREVGACAGSAADAGSTKRQRSAAHARMPDTMYASTPSAPAVELSCPVVTTTTCAARYKAGATRSPVRPSPVQTASPHETAACSERRRCKGCWGVPG